MRRALVGRNDSRGGLWAQPEVPEDLSRAQRNAMLYRRGMAQLGARKGDRGMPLLWVAPIFAVLLALTALLKSINGQ